MKIILTIIPMLLAAYSAKAADPAPTPTPIGPISYRVANNPLFGKPSPSPKPAPKKAQAQRESRDGTIGQSALGLSSGGSYNRTQSPRGYVGRNDGRVQQQGPAHAGAAMKTGSPSPAPARGSVYWRMTHRQDLDLNPPPPRNLTTNAKPSKGWSANASSGLANRPHVNYAGQGQGKPAGGQKKGEKASHSSSPR